MAKEHLTMQGPANFTQLLTDWRAGHPQALDRLAPLVYEELRRMASIAVICARNAAAIPCRPQPSFMRLFFA